MEELIQILEEAKTDKGGLPLDGYEQAENDGIDKAISLLENKTKTLGHELQQAIKLLSWIGTNFGYKKDYSEDRILEIAQGYIRSSIPEPTTEEQAIEYARLGLPSVNQTGYRADIIIPVCKPFPLDWVTKAQKGHLPTESGYWYVYFKRRRKQQPPHEYVWVHYKIIDA